MFPIKFFIVFILVLQFEAVLFAHLEETKKNVFFFQDMRNVEFGLKADSQIE